ncbi:MAG: hypothetical protein II520_02730, partial [Bacilli bacterium]|nr:hypothetical protein [Bacilli bacterium]
RDEAQGAIESDNIEKLREIVGRLEDAAAAAAKAQGQQAGPNPTEGQPEGNEGPDDVVDADFTDAK